MQENYRVMSMLLAIVLCALSITTSHSLLPPPITGSNGQPNAHAQLFKLPQIYSNLRVTHGDLEESVEFAEKIIQSLKRLESNLINAQIEIKNGSPSHGSFISFRPEEKAMERGLSAMRALKASSKLITTVCSDLDYDFSSCAKFVNKFTFRDTTLRDFCEHVQKQCTPEENGYMYRSADGTCNNVRNGALGESFTGYGRLLHPNYNDGVSLIRRAVNKSALPSPRQVSISLVVLEEKPHHRYTMALMQWGQFVEHDLSRTATSMMVHSRHTIECCEANGRGLSPRYVHPFCSPVHTPPSDTYNSKRDLKCMSYVRSLPAIRPDCSFGSTDQMNQATHYLDASQIYGSTFNKTSCLRTYQGGKLKTTTTEGKTYLPQSPYSTEDCQVTSDNSTCFVSGDTRVNFQPQLTVMHTLWWREHNRIARELAVLNVQWDDETLFQEARRIVIAMIQHITYKQWLPKVLAPSYIQQIEKFKEYNSKTNPTVSNSFATSAIRSLKSLYNNKIRLYNEERQVTNIINMYKHFNQPEVILKSGMFDSLVRSLATQNSEEIDMHYAEDLINKLYSDGRIGFDVVSLDIARSRDHGIPSYAHYRTLCGLEDPNSFGDLQDSITDDNISKLQEVYWDPKDIDLLIGGTIESPEAGSLFGPTFSCIIADQFMRTRQGDRYFYTNDKQPKPFSAAQLKEIRKSSLARIFCDNANDVESMQVDVFDEISEKNRLVPCDSDSIPRVSLIPWMEDRERYYH